MCMFIYLFVVYFSFAPVTSATTHLYCELFYIQVLTMVIITETLTSTSHHDIFTYLDYIFFLLPSYCRILSIFTFIYIYIIIKLFPYRYVNTHTQTSTQNTSTHTRACVHILGLFQLNMQRYIYVCIIIFTQKL